eukprot:1599665-Rhodomonas_salina.6
MFLAGIASKPLGPQNLSEREGLQSARHLLELQSAESVQCQSGGQMLRSATATPTTLVSDPRPHASHKQFTVQEKNSFHVLKIRGQRSYRNQISS